MALPLGARFDWLVKNDIKSYGKGSRGKDTLIRANGSIIIIPNNVNTTDKVSKIE